VTTAVAELFAEARCSGGLSSGPRSRGAGKSATAGVRGGGTFAPLNQVDVDLLFLQAINYERKKTRSSSQQHRHLLNGDSFKRALFDIALRVGAKLGLGVGTGSGGQEEIADAVSFFCAKILRPLSEGLLSSTSNKYGNAANLVAGSIDVSQFAVEMGKKSMVDLFHSPNVAEGINKVFTYYADQNIGSGGVGSRFGAGARRRENLAAMRWNLHGFLRFCQDFEITEELAHLPLQRIFQDCAHVEQVEQKSSGVEPAASGTTANPGLSKLGFQLALVLVAVKLSPSQMAGGGQSSSPAPLTEQVVALLHKLNHSLGMKDRPSASLRKAALFPNLPAVTRTDLAAGISPSWAATAQELRAADPQISERFFRTLRS